jgi:hypothetical protein
MFEFIFAMFISFLLIQMINRFLLTRPIKIDTSEMESLEKLGQAIERKRKQ